jgi:hypothetical protein
MKTILSLAFVGGLLFAGSAATAAVMAPPAPHTSSVGVLQVRDGCGRGYHEGRHGRCVSNDIDWRYHRHGDGCDRWHHWYRGRCVRNY